MDYAELYDLEEGEILEYDSTSPSVTAEPHFGVRSFSLGGLRKGSSSEHFGLKQKKDFYFGRDNDGYTNQALKEKLKLSEKIGGNKLNTSMIDLESISSDGECRSDEENKNSVGENRYSLCNAENKVKGVFYGTVEDIMSEIGETICRKSRCNYKKRKSKDLKPNVDRCSVSSYDLWRNELFFCHLRNKRRKRKGSFSDSNSDLPKERTERRKRRKKKKVFHYEEDKAVAKKSKTRDFDEVRRNLLEKLKKQQAEQESKASESELRDKENAEIQEVDMLIDCTNYVDEVRVAVPKDSTEEAKGITEKEREEKEDELDLTKLRLIALASNKKRKIEEGAQKTENVESIGAEKKCFSGDRKDLDLDRNELLLRAEALKSALLKKHQKRLNRLRVRKPDGFGDHNLTEAASSPTEESPKGDRLKSENEEDVGLTVDPDAFENPERRGEERERGTGTPSTPNSGPDITDKEMNKAVHQLSNVNGKRCHPKARAKRKKSKSGSFGNSLKENEKSEALEEDDRTLRCQLLNDLINKKSLKNLEKDSVPRDPARTPDGKASPPPSHPVISEEPPKHRPKPLPAVKTSAPRKMNATKTSKSVAVLKVPKPEIQRIIVHLGSEDSSDEDLAPGGAGKGAASTREKEKESKVSEAVKSSAANKEAGKMITADYERSVELLLSQARKKIEGKRQNARETLATPEAVYKHLPPSQRLEYIRLKQKIAERERLKMQIRDGKKENSSAPLGTGPPGTSDLRGKESAESVSEKPKPENLPKTDLKPISPSESSPLPNNVDVNSWPGSPGNSASICKAFSEVAGASGTKSKEANQRLGSNKAKNNLIGFCGKGLKKSVAPPGNGMKTALPIQRSTLLLPSSQALISKLKLLLKKIKIEKMIEENYGKEISKLRAQLSLFERKQSEQRFKIKKLGEESMKTYKAIQGITAKSNEKAMRKENGEKEKEDRGEPKKEGTKPQKEEGKNMSDEPVAEITKAQGKSEKESNSIDKISETGADGSAFAPCFLEYSSPLQTFNKVADCSKRVDPNVVMCQFDLMGVCKDEECTYQHLRES